MPSNSLAHFHFCPRICPCVSQPRLVDVTPQRPRSCSLPTVSSAYPPPANPHGGLTGSQSGRPSARLGLVLPSVLGALSSLLPRAPPAPKLPNPKPPADLPAKQRAPVSRRLLLRAHPRPPLVPSSRGQASHSLTSFLGKRSRRGGHSAVTTLP